MNFKIFWLEYSRATFTCLEFFELKIVLLLIKYSTSFTKFAVQFLVFITKILNFIFFIGWIFKVTSAKFLMLNEQTRGEADHTIKTFNLTIKKVFLGSILKFQFIKDDSLLFHCIEGQQEVDATVRFLDCGFVIVLFLENILHYSHFFQLLTSENMFLYYSSIGLYIPLFSSSISLARQIRKFESSFLLF